MKKRYRYVPTYLHEELQRSFYNRISIKRLWPVNYVSDKISILRSDIYDDEVDSNLAAVLFYAIKNPTL